MGHRLSRAGAVLRYNNLGHIYPVQFQSLPSKSRLCIHCALSTLIQTVSQHMTRTQIMTPGTAQGCHHVVEQQQPPELVHIWGTTASWHLRNLIYICQGSFVNQRYARIFHKYCPMCFL